MCACVHLSQLHRPIWKCKWTLPLTVSPHIHQKSSMHAGGDAQLGQVQTFLSSAARRQQDSAAQDAARVHAAQQQAQGTQQQPPRSLYVFNVEGRRWNAPLLLGLLDHFEKHYPNVVSQSIPSFFVLHRHYQPRMGSHGY